MKYSIRFVGNDVRIAYEKDEIGHALWILDDGTFSYWVIPVRYIRDIYEL